MKKIHDYIRDLARYGTEVTVIMPTTLLNPKTIEPDNFQDVRTALTRLQENPRLEVDTMEVEQGLTEVIISLKPENNEE